MTPEVQQIINVATENMRIELSKTGVQLGEDEFEAVVRAILSVAFAMAIKEVDDERKEWASAEIYSGALALASARDRIKSIANQL